MTHVDNHAALVVRTFASHSSSELTVRLASKYLNCHPHASHSLSELTEGLDTKRLDWCNRASHSHPTTSRNKAHLVFNSFASFKKEWELLFWKWRETISNGGRTRKENTKVLYYKQKMKIENNWKTKWKGSAGIKLKKLKNIFKRKIQISNGGRTGNEDMIVQYYLNIGKNACVHAL